MKKSKKTTKKEVDEAMEPNDMGRWTKNDGIYQSRKAVVHGHNVAENMVESDEGPQLGHWDENEGTYMPRKPVKPGHKVAEADQNPQLGHWDEDSLGAYKPKTAVKHGHKVAEDTVSEGDAGVYGKTGGGDPARHPNESLKALKSNRMNESKQELNSALNELRKNAGLPSI